MHNLINSSPRCKNRQERSSHAMQSTQGLLAVVYATWDEVQTVISRNETPYRGFYSLEEAFDSIRTKRALITLLVIL